MRLYLRLVMVDFVVLSLLLVPRYRHPVKNTPSVFVPLLIAALVLFAANFVIAWKAARHGDISSLDCSNWWLAVSCAWAAGPLCIAILPFAAATAIMGLNMSSVTFVALYLFWALMFLSVVYWRESSRGGRHGA